MYYSFFHLVCDTTCLTVKTWMFYSFNRLLSLFIGVKKKNRSTYNWDNTVFICAGSWFLSGPGCNNDYS